MRLDEAASVACRGGDRVHQSHGFEPESGECDAVLCHASAHASPSTNRHRNHLGDLGGACQLVGERNQPLSHGSCAAGTDGGWAAIPARRS